MVEKALAKHRLDPEQCWMFGDKARDIDCALGAGVRQRRARRAQCPARQVGQPAARRPALTLGLVPHILHNGQLLPDSAGVPVQNRGFLFADGIFETIRIAYGQPLFLEDHHQRIREGLKAHRIHAPLGFTPASIREDIKTLLEAEDITGGARVRITLTRSGAGSTRRKTAPLTSS